MIIILLINSPNIQMTIPEISYCRLTYAEKILLSFVMQINYLSSKFLHIKFFIINLFDSVSVVMRNIPFGLSNPCFYHYHPFQRNKEHVHYFIFVYKL